MNLVHLSKATAHALRHEPWLYELELDEEGWVAVDDLLAALRGERAEWAVVSETDLIEMIEISEKKRYEIRDGKIRAFYGHSTPQKMVREPTPPPPLLYHGTSPEAIERIKADGLRPMRRQYVHLSADTETAEKVGRRKAKVPTLLVIKAAEAHAAGVIFYSGNDQVWLADFVPALFIE